ncbi:MAG TPA: DUF1992 domain-containing protein [Burkholderiales bacterium]|nr:DUF1992 domain-containing protein [Burkholderiales bacterium]
MLDFLAEQKIAEAVSRGELDDLPGAGRPLELDDDLLVPEELRLAYRIMKNAGFVPPEVQTLNDIAQLERLVRDGATRPGVLEKLEKLRAVAAVTTAARRRSAAFRNRRRLS